jgi:hypothetical protein
VLKAILIFVLLGSTAMAKTDFEKKFKLPEGFEKDFESRVKIKEAISKFFKSKNLKVPNLEKRGIDPRTGKKEKGYYSQLVTSDYRPSSVTPGHRLYGGLDIAAGILGPHQEDFVDFMLKEGFRVIDERKAVSRSKHFRRGIFHIDDHPTEKVVLREEIPQRFKEGDKGTKVAIDGEFWRLHPKKGTGGYKIIKRVSSEGQEIKEPKKSFKQTFDEARSMGQKEFEFRGRRFNTRMKGESPEEFEEKFKFVDDQKFDSVEEFERSKVDEKDKDITEAIMKVREDARKPEQKIEADDIELEQTIPMDQSVPFGVFARGTDEFRGAQEQAFAGAKGGEVNPRIPRKKGQPAKSKKHSDLYTDEDPVGTIQGLGFKDVPTAKASVSKIRKSSRSHAHKVQAAVAMEQRAREMGKTSEAAVYRKFIDQMKEKTKEMSKAEGGEIRYQEGGEVYDVPEYLQRPKQNEPQDFMLEDITETEIDEIESRPDPFRKRERSPDFQGVREYQLSQMSVDELMSKKVPGQPQEPAVTRELARRKKEFGGMSLKRLAELDRDQKQREEAKRQKDEAERQRKKFQQLNRTKVEDKSQKELDESELRKALDDSIVQAEKAAQSVDPKRFYKNMSTFNKIVSLVGLAAGAYSSYKYGTPDTYLKLLNKQVDEDIKSQQLGLEGERRKLAAAKFKVGQIAKKLAMSTKNEEQKIRLLEVFQKQRTAGIKELKKLQDEQQLTNVNRIVNTRGITDDELSKFDSKYRKLKLRDSMIKGRNGLNYYVRGGPSNINKVKAYLADAQDSIDGLTDLYSYFDKISIVDQAAPIFSVDAAEAQSLRDRLVGKLRIEFFGPGVMTDQERAQAKKILGDPNALLTTDSREKPKILKLIMKLNYGVRDKLRRDGVAIQKTPNDLRIQQILSRRRLQDNAKNRRSVIDGLIKAEIDAQKAGAKPGTIWNMNEPLPI